MSQAQCAARRLLLSDRLTARPHVFPARRAHCILRSQRSSRAGGGVREGLGCGGHCRGGVLSLCFSRSLKKLVGARDQVSSHSCVVARRLWSSRRLGGGALGVWAGGSSNARAERCPKVPIDIGTPRMALAHAPDRHAMIPRSVACQVHCKPSRVILAGRREMDERQKFDNNKAPAVNVPDAPRCQMPGRRG